MVQSGLSLAKTNIFKSFYSKLAINLVKKIPIIPHQFNGGTTKDYYTGISNNKRNEFQLSSILVDLV